MAVHEFPSRAQNHANALSGVVDEVPEDDSEAFQRISFDIEELVRVRLDDLQEECHPLVESLVQAVVH